MAAQTGRQLPLKLHSRVEAQAPHGPLRGRHHVLLAWCPYEGLGEMPEPHMLEAGLITHPAWLSQAR